MEKLILLRHARHQPSSEAPSDHERRLVPEGFEAASRIGQILKEEGLVPQLVIMSDAIRCQQTWLKVSDHIGAPPHEVISELYLADSTTVDDWIEVYRDKAEILLVIGHNPGLHELAYNHSRQDRVASPDLLDELKDGFPTATAAVFEKREADGQFILTRMLHGSSTQGYN